MPIRGLKGGFLGPLRKEQLHDIHLSALEVLERVGIRAETDNMLKIFDNGGAYVDHARKTVKIPQYLVNETLKKAPKKVILCGRSKKSDLIVEDDRIYFGMGGSPKTRILDLETGSARMPTKKDVEDTTRLADALPGISFVQNIANSSNMPAETAYIHNTEAMLNNTEKHLVCTAANADQARTIIRMASVIEKDLKNRSVVSIYSCPGAPLLLTKSQENIVEAARRSVPVVICGAPQLGATAPVTVAGQVVQNISENLSVVVLSQLINPGTPIVIGATTAVMDPRTAMYSMGAPEHMISQVISTQMSHYYGLPYFGTAGCSDSVILDGQATAEAAMTLIICALSGMNMIQDVGVIGFDDIGSMELTVISDEIIGMTERILQWGAVDDESLAVDVISDVGPAGHFLSHKHTLKFVSKEYVPRLFNRLSATAWKAAGQKDLSMTAREKVKKILKGHRPAPLPPDCQRKLGIIVKEADRRLVRP